MVDELDCGLCRLRRWRRSDRSALIKHANNIKIWRNVRDIFPHPYTPAAADTFLSTVTEQSGPESIYAIEVGGEAVGGIGIHPRVNEERHTAEIGYWLGEPFWGRGIATAAVCSLSQRALKELDLYRLFANVFASNPASMRVLEKAGFQREGVLRRAVVKDGVLMDAVVYGLTRDPGLRYLPAPHEPEC
ncbi:MAG: GNAT family protein [Bryobacteraceae bacterium]